MSGDEKDKKREADEPEPRERGEDPHDDRKRREIVDVLVRVLRGRGIA
jgi:hypothetical protein